MFVRCFNYITILGPSAEITRFVEANTGIPPAFYTKRKVSHPAYHEKIFTMSAFLPIPKKVLNAGDDPTTGRKNKKMYGQDWKLANWGTPWDATTEPITPEEMGYNPLYPGCELRFSFMGKNTPPYKWFAAVTEAFPNLTLYLEYSSADSNKRGWYLGVNGCVSSHQYTVDDIEMYLMDEDDLESASNESLSPLPSGIDAKPLAIPNELSCQFVTLEGRRKLISLYGHTSNAYSGVNSDAEGILVSFDTNHGIVLKTFQHNGFTRVNYYDADGHSEGETFEGRWRD